MRSERFWTIPERITIDKVKPLERGIHVGVAPL